jgi:hypothetical protein
VKNAIHKCGEFPDDSEEYPYDLPGLTQVPRLLQGFTPRHYFENTLKCPSSKSANKLTLKKNEKGEYYVKENEISETLYEGDREKKEMCLRRKIARGKYIYVCSSCNYSKVTRAAVEGHYRQKHLDMKPFSCTQCDYTSYNYDRFKQHTKYDGCSKNKYSCSKCSFVSSSKGSLLNHKKTHKAPQYKCSGCGKKFTHSFVLKKHTEKCI